MKPLEKNELTAAQPVRELSVGDTDAAVQLSSFGFETTAEIEPLDQIIGQDRAMNAIQLGLGVPHEGYNIFVAGLTGTGKMNTIKRSLQKRLDNGPVPEDWVYVHNFDNPDEPQAIKLSPGKGKQLKKDMHRLVERLKQALPKAFRQEDFSREKEQLSEKYQQQSLQQTERLEKMAKEHGFAVNLTSSGQISFVPLIDGKPAESREQIDKLGDEEKQRIREAETTLAKEANKIMQQQRDTMQNLSEEVRDIERRFGAYVVKPMIENIKESYKDNEPVLQYLDRVGEHVLDNLQDFQQKEKKQGGGLMGALMQGSQTQPQFLEYEVNLLVDRCHCETAPVVIEDAPTYRNLFGNIDRTVDARGRLVTNFTQIKAGSLLRANGGYLVFNIEDALTEPFVYKNLKRALKSGSTQIESFNPWLPFSTGTLRPKPIPITTKVVVLGRPLIYHLLRLYDEEFGSIFKVKADFGTEMPRNESEHMHYARFVAGLAKEENLRRFSRNAVAEIVRFAARRAGKKDKLYTRFSEVADLLREANYFAGRENGEVVGANHIRKALDNRIFRSERIAEKIRELIKDGTLLVDAEGTKVGQVNGLAIVDQGDYAFGKPSRVTASVGLGSEGLINIEREAKLSGGTHDKGVLILAGFLRNTYGADKPLAVSASICFEQSYSGVEGDSASATELFALLSTLARIPLRQDIAVTGSVNQWGQIQAIGGVNEKIEGYFDVCRTVGLTGSQGVCIPAGNVQNLILRADVREAVENGQFHIYPIETVDQGLELLTGIQAGTTEQDGTLHCLIDRRLTEMARTLKQFGPSAEAKSQPPAEQPAPVSPPAPPASKS